jgi:phage terminase small subunit
MPEKKKVAKAGTKKKATTKRKPRAKKPDPPHPADLIEPIDLCLDNIRHETFIAAYIRTGNKSEAARVAGYVGRHAGQAGGAMLKNPDVARALAVMREKISQRCTYDAEKVHRELAAIAFADMHDFATWGGDSVWLRDSHAMTPDLTAAIAEVKVDERSSTTDDGGRVETRTAKLRLHDKLAALDKLCKLQGWYSPEKKDLAVTLRDVGAIATSDLATKLGFAAGDEGEDESSD